MRSSSVLRSTWIGLVAIGVASSASAAPHLGMKLATKRFSDAWNTGRLNALRAEAAPELSAVLGQLSQEEFTRLWHPRSGSVVNSQKNGSTGTLTIQTKRGIGYVTLRGSGFRWQVVDVRCPDEQGVPQSLKESVTVAVTSRDFLHAVARNDWPSALRRATPAFAQALAAPLPPNTVQIPREIAGAKPQIRIDGHAAVMRLAAGTSGTTSTLDVHLSRTANRWQVHDVALRSPATVVPSLRAAAPAIHLAARLRSFAASPATVEPNSFTVGTLQDELVALRSSGRSGFLMSGAKPTQVELNAEGSELSIRYPNRVVVRMDVDRAAPVIRNVWLVKDGQKRSLAESLALLRTIREFSPQSLVAMAEATAIVVSERATKNEERGTEF